MYHGTPAERAELRRTVMRLDERQAKDGDGDEKSSSAKKANIKTKKSGRKSVIPRKKSGADKKTTPQTNIRRSARKSGQFNRISDDDEEESEEESDDDYKDEENSNDRDALTEDDIPIADGTTSPTSAPTAPPSSENERDMSTFPVVITTYEMIIRDRVHLAHYDWGYIVVDEGHRLKNYDCKLMQEIKKYPSAGRMILTGTPLHVSLFPSPSFFHLADSDDLQNNLAELWSLLNFILPDIFEDLDAFQEWYVALGTATISQYSLTSNSRFNLGTMQSHLSSERSSHIVHSLHAILKPFLLRRLKVDVETSLPPKKEYVLYAPLSERQNDVYDQVVKGDLRSFLMGKGKADNNNKEKKKQLQIDVNAPRKSRYNGKKRKRYDVDGDDDEYFDRLERGDMDEKPRKEEEDVEEIGREYQYKATCES
jgi:ATP-dependent DNA helicase